MYQPETGWPNLRAVIGPALAGDYQPLLEMAYGPAMMVNPADSPYLAVMCHDLQTTRNEKAPQRLAQQWRKQAFMTGAGRAWSLQPCETWPVKAAWRPRPIAAQGSGAILIVAGQHDPATPITWARALQRSLAHSALLEWKGDGHIGYGRGGPCVNNAIEMFLTAPVPSTQGIECP
jgi:pimeloyl-ACP methyl ester carboxylesterase